MVDSTFSPRHEHPGRSAGSAPRRVPTHHGLEDLDPWAPEERPGLRAVWPWGLSQLSETLEIVALAILMFVAFRSVGHTYIVSGQSMEPSFENADMLMVNRLAYRTFDLSWVPGLGVDEWRPFGTPARGDVVVFDYPNDVNRDFIKRVVGLPGDTVEVRQQRVYVNGIPVDEPYLEDPPAYDYGPAEVPQGHVFVLGDNRNNSFDSHNWGMLEQSLIIGRADLRYWPLQGFGAVPHYAIGGPEVTVERSESRASGSGVPASP